MDTVYGQSYCLIIINKLNHILQLGFLNLNMDLYNKLIDSI